ncbi:MAG: hypothetical protein K6T85_18015, partial [Gorillibacterium sp.]|nr:hypothetical protein [Gorillibacterium sp.]
AYCDQAALHLIETQQPDIIVTDAKLLLLSDGALLDRLESQYLPSKIIVTSSYEFVLQAFFRGGVDSLLKPFDTDKLKNALLRAFAATRQGSLCGIQPSFATFG